MSLKGKMFCPKKSKFDHQKEEHIGPKVTDLATAEV
ncbi:hypothetical protein Gogos_005070, partial [Gossypium gossypioides]|nr:hypothetical protein [Gossypium gossypioides]